MKTFSGKTVVITGAGSALGRGLACSLAKKGAHLALSDVNEATLNQTAERLPPNTRVTIEQVDVADRKAFHAYAKKTIQAYGAVDAVINNASAALPQAIEEMPYEKFECLVNTNLWGMLHGVKAFLPHLKARPDAHIVNITSLFGLISAPGLGAYNMTQFAVRGFTETLRQELDCTSVNVTCAYVGGIRPGADVQQQVSGADSERVFGKNLMINPEGCARQIVKAMLKNKSRALVGMDAKIGDLIQRLAPRNYERLIARIIH